MRKKKISIIDKTKRFLKRNDLIIDFISKIIFNVCSIILLVIANNLTKAQITIDKNNMAPYFFIEESKDIKVFSNLYKLENKGGLVYHLKLSRFDYFEITVDKLNITENIYYFSDKKASDYDKDNIWYFAPIQKYINTASFREKLLKDLNDKYPDHYINILIPSSFYELEYHDYQNVYKNDYYRYSYSGISYDKYLSENGINGDNKSYYDYSITGVMLARYDSEKELYKVFRDAVMTEVDRYIQYKNTRDD